MKCKFCAEMFVGEARLRLAEAWVEQVSLGTPAGHSLHLKARTYLADCLRAGGQSAEAVALLREVLGIAERSLGPDNPEHPSTQLLEPTESGKHSDSEGF